MHYMTPYLPGIAQLNCLLVYADAKCQLQHQVSDYYPLLQTRSHVGDAAKVRIDWSSVTRGKDSS